MELFLIAFYFLVKSSRSKRFNISKPINEWQTICHSVNKKNVAVSKHVLVFGAATFLGSRIAVRLDQSGYKLKLVEDQFNLPLDPMSWYRWQKLQEKKLNPEFVDPIDPDAIRKTLIAHSTDTVIFIPSHLLEDFASTNSLKLKLVRKSLRNFVNILEAVQSEQKLNMRVILLSLPGHSKSSSLQKSWLRAFELTLSSYQSIYGLPVGVISMDGIYGEWEGKENNVFPQKNSCLYVGRVEETVLNVLNEMEQCVDLNVSDDCSKEDVTMNKTMLWANEHTKFLKNRKDVVMSTYLTHSRNPIYSYQTKPNSAWYMRPWFFSAIKHKLNTVIFHDSLSKEFQDRAQKFYPNTEFVSVKSIEGRTTNDYRYYLFHKYLLEHTEIRRAVITDMRDVRFFGDPFEQMDVIGDYLYVGTSVPFYLFPLEHPWVNGIIRNCHRSDSKIDAVKLHPHLNAGVLGGNRYLLLAFLTQATRYFDKAPHNQNCNMGTFTVVAHKYFFDQIYAGYPIQSAFKILTAGNSPQGLSIKHKDID